MIGSLTRESSLFYVALGHQASLIKDDLGPGPKHGPHLQIGWPGDNGKTTGCYVPIAAQPHIRAGANDWQSVQMALHELGELDRDAIIAEARDAKAAARRKRLETPLADGPARPRRNETSA